MSNEKNTANPWLPERGTPAVSDGAESVAKDEPITKPKVVALAIDEDFDAGGDPYNHTGSHYVAKIRDDE